MYRYIFSLTARGSFRVDNNNHKAGSQSHAGRPGRRVYPERLSVGSHEFPKGDESGDRS